MLLARIMSFLGTERPLRGINSLTCTVVGRGESISQEGQTIEFGEVEIAKLASFEVQMIWPLKRDRLESALRGVQGLQIKKTALHGRMDFS
jgi:hypothetical protein